MYNSVFVCCILARDNQVYTYISMYMYPRLGYKHEKTEFLPAALASGNEWPQPQLWLPVV